MTHANTSADQPVPLTVPKVARMLGLAESTVRRAIRNDGLKSIRFGRQLLIRPADLEAYMSGKQNPDTSQA